MQSRLTKTIIGAVIAVALAVAVSYGLISQQTADQIQTQANQTLQAGPGADGSGMSGTAGTQPAPQRPDAVPQGEAPRSPSRIGSALDNPAPQPGR